MEVYQQYIGAYSSGVLNRNEPFRIEFTNPVITADQVESEFSSDHYKITPALPGKCVWKATNVLEFIPDKEKLQGNVEYQFTINLEAIIHSIPKALQKLAIVFKYLPVSLSVQWKFLRSDPNHSGSMYLSGKVNLNDYISAEKLMTLFSINSSSGQKIPIKISPSESDPNLFEILLSPIERTNTKQEKLVIRWNHLPEKENDGWEERTFDIPAQNEFVVTGVDDSRVENHNLAIYFSDELDEKQDIRGMVKLKNDSVVLDILNEKDILQLRIPDSWQKDQGLIEVNSLIRSKTGKTLSATYEYSFLIHPNPPQVRFTNQGSILPYAKNIILPFEAINLHTIEVEVFKTFANNVLYNMHLGFNDDYDGYNMVRLGRIVKQKVIKLDELSPGSNEKEWKRYGLDLSELIDAEIGAFYQVRICFKPYHSKYNCSSGKLEIPENFYDEYTGDSKITSFWRAYSYYDYTDNGNNDSNDPCNLSYYYKDHFAKISFFASNLAMIAKASDDGGDCFVAVYDVQDGSPVKAAELNFYDNQLQIIGTDETDGNGMAKKVLKGKPSFVVAKKGKHFSYLKIEEHNSLSQSEFEIGGIKLQDGLKASIYTERGVWRPGDTVYFNAILYQMSQQLPALFPVELIVKNPLNQIIFKSQKSNHDMGLFVFQIPIKASDLTGIYKAQLKVGFSVFEKNLLVETIKPNRFKVEWPYEDEIPLEVLSKGIQFKAMWLHGAPAASKMAQVSLKYQTVAPGFHKYNNYTFVDPANQNISGEMEIYNNKLDENGEGIVMATDLLNRSKTGKLKTTFITKIIDDAGDITTDYFESTISKLKEFVGIKLPENPYGRQIAVGTDQEVRIVVLDNNGVGIPNREVKVELFRVSYEWWYELRNRNMGDYQRKNFEERVTEQTVVTDSDGFATFKMNLKDYDRYYLRATNKNNQYETGEYFYSGWNYNGINKEFVNILSFKTDKEQYSIGEKASINFPGSGKGIYLISLLRGNKIIKTISLPAQKEKTLFNFDVSAEMAPNVYIDVSFIQGKKDKKNDLPLRLYGIIPLKVEDKNKKLLPVIKMQEMVKPDEKFTIDISEENGREMVYQIYIVDEGLLNLTRFKTPNPYQDIMAKEALSIFTWDNFNEVIGNLDGAMEKIFSIGGDQALVQGQEQINKRFNPVVLKSGPLKLGKGSHNQHEFLINNYVGAVRVMVVANHYDAFGAADKTVAVKKELMTQLTVPRVFSYNDEVLIPVTVFVSDPKIKETEVSLDVQGKIGLADQMTKRISFKQTGDQTIYFRVKGVGSIGNASISASAKSGNFNSNSMVRFYVDNPNPMSREVKQYWVNPGQEMNSIINPYGMEGSRNVTLEVSGLQGFSMSEKVDQLITYPHGCLEQITSGAFSQVYLPYLMELSNDRKIEIAKNIQVAFDKLRRFQLQDGSFSYWPGADDYSDWNTSYIGNFLIEAKSAGYQVPDDLIRNWYSFQRSKCNSFVLNSNKHYVRPGIFQAYRLYTLSLYGKPEWSAMNQLYQTKTLDLMSNILLAGAYAIAGKKEIAKELFNRKPIQLNYYREFDYSYGSNSRDEALIAQIMLSMDMKPEANSLIQKLILRNKNNYSYSTQEMAVILVTLGKLYGKNSKDHTMKFTYHWNESKTNAESGLPSYSVNLKPSSVQKFRFVNQGSTAISVSLIQSGKETSVEPINIANGLKMNFEIISAEKKSSSYESGESLNFLITVINTGVAGRLDNLALSVVIPSGIEFENKRIGGIYSKSEKIDYQDFRDDRVLNYFSLDPAEEIKLIFPANASYPGKYSGPVIYCEAMYDPSIFAKIKSGPLSIVTKKR